MWHQLIITTIIILVVSQCTSILLFDKSKSYAVYDTWNITRTGQLELNFRTNCRYCLLLYIDNKNEDKTSSLANNEDENYLELSLTGGKLELTLQAVSRSYKKTVIIGQNLNDLKWHSLKLQKYIESLMVDVDNDYSERLAIPGSVAKRFRINSRLYIGGLAESNLPTSYGSAKLKQR